MTSTEKLLALRPTDAIVSMLNDENGTSFPSDVFEFGPPVAGVGSSTTVQLRIRKSSQDDLDVIPYSGSVNFTYHRLNVAVQFVDVLDEYKPQLPISTQVLLDELTARTGQKFYPEDFVLEEIRQINSRPYRLKAKPESWRWYGVLEVDLGVDLIELGPFISAGLPADGVPLDPVDESPQLTAVNINQPFINGTPLVSTFDSLPLDVEAQLNPQVVETIQKSVPAPYTAEFSPNPWIDALSPTPGPYNLYNAKITQVDIIAEGVNPTNPALNRVLKVELDPAYCTNFKFPEFYIPYYLAEQESTFSVEPRFSRAGVRSTSDGSEFSVYLNAFQVNDVWTTLDVDKPFMIDGPEPWVVDASNRSKTNLYNAKVLYNGAKRNVDPAALRPGLNRVMVVQLSEYNTAFAGTYAFHYRAPIILPEALPNGSLGIPYSVTLQPTEGQGPYTFTVIGGSLVDGHVFDEATGTLSGSASAVGLSTLDLIVTDQRGVSVDYHYKYSVAIAELMVGGEAIDATIGDSYYFHYSVLGGKAPYQIVWLEGSLPEGLSFDVNTATIQGTLAEGTEGTYTWRFRVTDARNISVEKFDSIVIREVELPQLSEALPTQALSGLQYPDLVVQVELPTIMPVQELDGIAYPPFLAASVSTNVLPGLNYPQFLATEMVITGLDGLTYPDFLAANISQTSLPGLNYPSYLAAVTTTSTLPGLEYPDLFASAVPTASLSGLGYPELADAA